MMRLIFLIFLISLSKEIFANDMLPDDAILDFNSKYPFDIEPTHLYYNNTKDFRIVSDKGKCLEVFNSSVKFDNCQSTEGKQFWYVIILEQESHNYKIVFNLFNKEKNIYLGYDNKNFKKIKTANRQLAYPFNAKTSVKNKSNYRQLKKIYCENIKNSWLLLELDSYYGCPGWGSGVSNEYIQISKAEFDNKNQKDTTNNNKTETKITKTQNETKKIISNKTSNSLDEKGYADCILENMKDVSSDAAAKAIKEACTYKYLSENNNSNVVSNSNENTSTYSDNTIGVVSLPTNLSSCGSITKTRFPIFTGC